MDRMLEQTYVAEQRHFWFRGFQKFVLPFLRAATRGISNPRLLDCGSGTGANLALLAQFGTAYGVDRTWRGLELAKSRGIGRLAQASVDALPIASDSVDVAASFDVLYCLEDAVERRAIAEMFRILRPGASAIINAAALDMLRGDHSVLVEEVRRYTRRSLAERLEAAGFHIARVTYTNAATFPIAAAVRWWQRHRGITGDRNGDFYVPPAPINAMLSAALSAEARLVEAGMTMPVGSSVLCVARKPARTQT